MWLLASQSEAERKNLATFVFSVPVENWCVSADEVAFFFFFLPGDVTCGILVP